MSDTQDRLDDLQDQIDCVLDDVLAQVDLRISELRKRVAALDSQRNRLRAAVEAAKKLFVHDLEGPNADPDHCFGQYRQAIGLDVGGFPSDSTPQDRRLGRLLVLLDDALSEQ